MAKRTLKLPISIVAARGGYCVPMEIGCNQEVAHLLLDTGSSTIAVETKAYDPAEDFYLEPTSYAQTVTYGSGGWAGPLVNTHLCLEEGNKKMLLKEAYIAVIKSEQQDNFYGADGILGLAYKQLNRAYDLSDYFVEKNIETQHTYPWHFEIENSRRGIRSFKRFLKQYPSTNLMAFFCELEERRISKNKFSLYTKRSIVHVDKEDASKEEMEQDPLNQGYLILGSGEQHRELYHGELESIDVVHDAYYNTHLISMQVGDGREIMAPELKEEYKGRFYSNSIIDCGTSFVVLQAYLYQELLDELIDIKVDFIRQIDEFTALNERGEGYFPQDLNLDEWPEVHFYFLGPEGQKVKLTCTPDNYWQLNALAPGRAYFMFMDQFKRWPAVSILGLPLISDYFCVFDREYDANGIIKVGKVKL